MLNSENQNGGGCHLGFNKMLISSTLIAIFGCNLNSVSPCTTKIGKFDQNCKISKTQDGGDRHLGFSEILIASMWIWLFGCYLNYITPGVTEIGKFHKNAKFKNIKVAAAVILDLPKC